MPVQNHNSPNMQMFRSSQFHNCVSQNPEIANMQIFTVLSTTMSQCHEITKLHIFQVIVIVGTTMTPSSCSKETEDPEMQPRQSAFFCSRDCCLCTKHAGSEGKRKHQKNQTRATKKHKQTNHKHQKKTATTPLPFAASESRTAARKQTFFTRENGISH